MHHILPVHHFHIVFTLPGDLQELARRNRALVFDLLLKSAAGALATLARDPKWFGQPTMLGTTTVLHAWARDLHFHPRAHCIVTASGHTLDDDTWVSAPQDFRLPVHVLDALFRGIFLDGLERVPRRPWRVPDHHRLNPLRRSGISASASHLDGTCARPCPSRRASCSDARRTQMGRMTTARQRSWVARVSDDVVDELLRERLLWNVRGVYDFWL